MHIHVWTWAIDHPGYSTCRECSAIRDENEKED